LDAVGFRGRLWDRRHVLLGVKLTKLGHREFGIGMQLQCASQHVRSFAGSAEA
jgi:hypothetical protein